jgi:hypothetical protein
LANYSPQLLLDAGEFLALRDDRGQEILKVAALTAPGGLPRHGHLTKW